MTKLYDLYLIGLPWTEDAVREWPHHLPVIGFRPSPVHRHLVHQQHPQEIPRLGYPSTHVADTLNTDSG